MRILPQHVPETIDPSSSLPTKPPVMSQNVGEVRAPRPPADSSSVELISPAVVETALKVTESQAVEEAPGGSGNSAVEETPVTLTSLVAMKTVQNVGKSPAHENPPLRDNTTLKDAPSPERTAQSTKNREAENSEKTKDNSLVESPATKPIPVVDERSKFQESPVGKGSPTPRHSSNPNDILKVNNNPAASETLAIITRVGDEEEQIAHNAPVAEESQKIKTPCVQDDSTETKTRSLVTEDGELDKESQEIKPMPAVGGSLIPIARETPELEKRSSPMKDQEDVVEVTPFAADSSERDLKALRASKRKEEHMRALYDMLTASGMIRESSEISGEKDEEVVGQHENAAAMDKEYVDQSERDTAKRGDEFENQERIVDQRAEEHLDGEEVESKDSTALHHEPRETIRGKPYGPDRRGKINIAKLRTILRRREPAIMLDYLSPTHSQLMDVMIKGALRDEREDLGNTDKKARSRDELRGSPNATAPRHPDPFPRNPMPLGHHLLYFPPFNQPNDLMTDGTIPQHHPGRPFFKRMWAGGKLVFTPGWQERLRLDGRLAVCIERPEDARWTVAPVVERKRDPEPAWMVKKSMRIGRLHMAQSEIQRLVDRQDMVFVDVVRRYGCVSQTSILTGAIDREVTNGPEIVETRTLVFLRDENQRIQNHPEVEAKGQKTPKAPKTPQGGILKGDTAKKDCICLSPISRPLRLSYTTVSC